MLTKATRLLSGGTGSRHPQLARTVSEFTDVAGVLGILEKAVVMYRDYPLDKKEISFHAMISKEGVENLI